MNMALLEIKNVNKQYGNYQALDNVSLSIEKGKVFGLLGPNGAGKTTLIRIINAITAPDSGEVLFDGHPLSLKDTPRIGYLPEERGLYRKMKVGEQALYLCQLKGLSKSDAKQRLKYWFEKYGIEDWWDKKVMELSKGMAQKIQFITTVLHEPEMLIFDEPFSGFDPVNTNLLKQEILSLKDKGATIIFSTHNMESVEELCEDIALINKAKVGLQGNVDDIKQKHKDNLYRVITSDRINPSQQLFTILSCEETKRGWSQVVRLNELSGNDFLAQMIQKTAIVEFEELLPTMNDIFIKSVESKL